MTPVENAGEEGLQLLQERVIAQVTVVCIRKIIRKLIRKVNRKLSKKWGGGGW